MASMRDDIHAIVNMFTTLARHSADGEKNADWHIKQMTQLGVIKCTEALPEQYKYMVDQMAAAADRLKEAIMKSREAYNFMSNTPFDELSDVIHDSLFSTSFNRDNCVDIEYMLGKLTKVYTEYIDLLCRCNNFVADNIVLLQALEIQLGVIGMHCPTAPTKAAGFNAHIVLHVGNPELGEAMRKAVEDEEQRHEAEENDSDE